jgi:hypothetical protein
MRKSVLLALVAALLAYGTAFAEYDPTGRWLLEGSGFAEKSFLRVELTDWGELDIRTEVENGTRLVTGYGVQATLNASKLNINAWKYSASSVFQVPLEVPKVDPTANEPFKLPSFTSDGLTYEVEFTSASAGTVKIYGEIDRGIEINSINTLWKEGMEKPSTSDMTSGCDVGVPGGIGLLLASIIGAALPGARRDKTNTRVKWKS